MPLQPNLFPTRCTQNQSKIKNHNSSKAIKQKPESKSYAKCKQALDMFRPVVPLDCLRRAGNVPW